jgi:hypothetical protein
MRIIGSSAKMQFMLEIGASIGSKELLLQGSCIIPTSISGKKYRPTILLMVCF